MAARAGARVVEPSALASYGDRPALLVAANTIIDLPLFADGLPRSASRLGSTAGLVAGPAQEIARYASNPAADALPVVGIADGAGILSSLALSV